MTQVMQSSLFDYMQLDTETRIVVQQRTEEIKTLLRRTTDDIIDIGRKLIDVKARLGHGNFGGWLEAEFSMRHETASRIMGVAKVLGDKFDPGSNLEIHSKALYLLASPSTPEPARIEAIQRAQVGEVITHKVATAIVAEHKPAERNAHYEEAVAESVRTGFGLFQLPKEVKTAYWTPDPVDAPVMDSKALAATVKVAKREYETAKETLAAVRAEQRAKVAIDIAPVAATPAIPANAVVINADSRTINRRGIAPVHLIVTSPPYNVGIDYNEHDDNMSQDEYLDLIEDVFCSCFDVMADGARIAVNVPFGVGRNPWVPFAARVTDILSSCGFTLRGQIIWDKGNSGNRTSWGSFRLPSDPSLRDTSEAIIVGHKGSSKLLIPESVKQVDAKGTHTPALASSDYFMELAQDHWIVAPESAKRLGHPAPFPVALARRLIDFYAYPGAHILDPFAGSGSTGIAALEAGCSVTLVEVDPTYCRLIEERLSSD